MTKANSIDDKNAEIYYENVKNHNLNFDIEFLMKKCRFPVSSKIADIGCGTGILLRRLGEAKEYNRELKGIDASERMFKYATENLKDLKNAEVILSQFKNLRFELSDWIPDIMIMSFFLHHCDDIGLIFQKAAENLNRGGKLYIYDRISIIDSSKSDFHYYWENCYKYKHEWDEKTPNIQSLNDIETYGQKYGFRLIKYLINPNDGKIGCNLFPKSLVELWKVEEPIFNCVIIPPAFEEKKNNILKKLISETSIENFDVLRIPYTKNVLEEIYPNLPWGEEFFQFAEAYSPNSKASVIIPKTNNSIQILAELSQFKEYHRNEFGEIRKDTEQQYTAKILPFHIPEPWESFRLKKIIEQYNEPL